jgi:flavin reductase (DIM6/NTAB) family NADH-FMN oxidoreductase RutF
MLVEMEGVHAVRTPGRCSARPRLLSVAGSRPSSWEQPVENQGYNLIPPMNGQLARAIQQIPCGVFVLTSAFEHARSGALVRWVQQCSSEPAMVMFAMTKGMPVQPLIRDSRSFALCQITADDRFLLKKFETSPAHNEDPFVSIPTTCAPSGSPIISRAISWLDCELVRHIDLESNFALYVGLIHHGAVLNGPARPVAEPRENGLSA